MSNKSIDRSQLSEEVSRQLKEAFRKLLLEVEESAPDIPPDRRIGGVVDYAHSRCGSP